jgi:hypothetical protein
MCNEDKAHSFPYNFVMNQLTMQPALLRLILNIQRPACTGFGHAHAKFDFWSNSHTDNHRGCAPPHRSPHFSPPHSPRDMRSHSVLDGFVGLSSLLRPEVAAMFSAMLAAGSVGLNYYGSLLTENKRVELQKEVSRTSEEVLKSVAPCLWLGVCSLRRQTCITLSAVHVGRSCLEATRLAGLDCQCVADAGAPSMFVASPISFLHCKAT